uniref:NTF2-related export protein n=1 Tax=Ornithorhynchus anatinus TaxID=9258 RepID=A0A6I8PIF9_ORNAN
GAQRGAWHRVGAEEIPGTVLAAVTGPGSQPTDTSCLTWEGQRFRGKATIMEKMMSLPFPKVRRSLTSQDHQPAPDNRIASTVVGRLKIDEDPAMGFRQIFLLKNANEKWICTDDNLQAAPPKCLRDGHRF